MRTGAALLALKASVQAAGGPDAGGGLFPLWHAGSHPCGDARSNWQAWPGVQCNQPTGSVLALELSGKQLQGTLPAELGRLPLLREL